MAEIPVCRVQNVDKTRRRGEVLAFFREQVLPYRGSSCLIWPFSSDLRGYPQVAWGGKNYRVHRLSCEEYNGPPPSDGLDAAHNCGNRKCVNPAHMSWKTRKANMADTLTHGTRRRGVNTHQAKLSEDEVRQIRLLRGKEKQPETAKKFGVSNVTVSNIQTGYSWKWLD
jgi:DNA-binding transcriptional regulator YiaG